MNNYNEKKEEKGGFLSALSGIFRGGSSAMGGASSGIGSAGGLGGLFATKAGIVGMVLGGATIAAGVGVVYNFVGSSSKPVYSPELFQNSYYEEESNAAGEERARARDTSSASASTLDMFREQAKKDGLSGLAAEGGGEGSEGAAAAPAPADGAANADASAEAPAAAGGSASATGAAKLQAAPGFGGKGGGAGGGSGTAMPRMQNGGGLSGGIGNQFASMYRAPAGADGGKVSGMSAMAARMKSSPKYAVPNFNKKGAHAQAKFASKMGAKAAYSADGAGARTMATEAFTGETTGAGDVAGGEGGAGLGGAGISGGANLKGNDPSLNSNSSSVPKLSDPEKDSPWQEIEDNAMMGMLIAAGLILVTKILGKFTKSVPWLYYIAVATAVAAILAALYVVYQGILMMMGDPDNKKGKGAWDGQMWMGGMYIAAGVMLAIKAWDALCGLEHGETTTNTTTEKSPTDPTQTKTTTETFNNGKSTGPAETKYSTTDANTKFSEKGPDGKLKPTITSQGGYKPMGGMAIGDIFKGM